MLAAGILSPSTSPWSFPVVVATKKDGNPRICIDYRSLNERMPSDRWPLPRIQDLFDDLTGSSVFTTLDLFAGYWQIQMDPSCKEMTTFICRQGTYQFEVMPFGLKNAPSTFQRMMDMVFKIFPFVRAYIDDVVVFSKSVPEHLEHLGLVFTRLAETGLKIKVKKCEFLKSRVALLGHVVERGGVKADESKVAAIQDAPIPENVTQLRGFLGLAGYYRRFIKLFAQIAKSLNAATSKKRKFLWTPEIQIAFDTLKTRLTSPPVLTFPDFDEPFVVETDASSSAVGAVLAQRKEDGLVHPLQFASRSLNAAERNYAVCERVAAAVIFALKKFRVYLLADKPFQLVTDHQALQYAFKKKDVHGRLARWLDLLAEYEFEVVYR